MNVFNHKPKRKEKANCSITSHMIIYMMNTISPISLYIKLDKLQSLKKDFTCINVFPASTNQKPYFSNVCTGCRTL